MSVPTVHANSTGSPATLTNNFTTTASFSNLNGGAAFSSGKLVVALFNNTPLQSSNSDWPPLMTVGSASQSMINTFVASTNRSELSLWYADIPSGTTDTLLLTSTISAFETPGVQSWLLTNVALGGPSTTATIGDFSNPPITITIASSQACLTTWVNYNNAGTFPAGHTVGNWTNTTSSLSDMEVLSTAPYEMYSANSVTVGAPTTITVAPASISSTAWTFNGVQIAAVFNPSTGVLPLFTPVYDDSNEIMNMAKIVEMVGY